MTGEVQRKMRIVEAREVRRDLGGGDEPGVFDRRRSCSMFARNTLDPADRPYHM